MTIISTRDIESLCISPRTCVEWVKLSFMLKERAQLPPKVSVHPVCNDFFYNNALFVAF